MKERNLAILITLILIIMGLFIGLITSFLVLFITSGNIDTSYNEFNFYKSELDINGTYIKETLYYQTDKPYHTLFRNFQSKITAKNSFVKNSISIDSVECQEGSAYFRISNNCYQKPDFTKPMDCPLYTEDNEYGCTFGNNYGFEQGKEYQISSEFTLAPDNLFKINGKYYIKFIAYGRNNHKPLTLNDNLVIKGDAIYTNEYISKEYVIIYIPYNSDIKGFNIIEKPDFEYDSTINKKSNPVILILITLGIIIMHLLPAVLFLSSWYFFGKELTEGDVPEQLSTYPTNRKPWEVAVFFNPPFGKIDRNFFSTMLFDFYRRKIIDLKLKKGFFQEQLMIKINKKEEALDYIEKEFLKILSAIKDYCPEKYIEGEYFNLNKSAGSYTTQSNLRTIYLDFQKSLDYESKKYLEKKGTIFFIVSMIVLGFVSFPLILPGLFFLCMTSIIIVAIIASTSSLLIKYKGEFYNEYLKWQSFKKWLKGSPSMKETGHKGVVLWEEYLVYATALGVSKQVLKELKNEGLIDDKKYNFYTGVNLASTSFAVSSGSGGHGGGFGGAGGGGVGGGGGGGR